MCLSIYGYIVIFMPGYMGLCIFVYIDLRVYGYMSKHKH